MLYKMQTGKHYNVVRIAHTQHLVGTIVGR